MTPRESEATVRRKGNAVDVAGVSFEAAHLLAGLHVPQPHHRIIPAAGKGVAPVRGKGHAVQPVGMPLEAANLADGLHPDLDDLFPAALQRELVRGQAQGVFPFGQFELVLPGLERDLPLALHVDDLDDLPVSLDDHLPVGRVGLDDQLALLGHKPVDGRAVEITRQAQGEEQHGGGDGEAEPAPATRRGRALWRAPDRFESGDDRTSRPRPVVAILRQ